MQSLNLKINTNILSKDLISKLNLLNFNQLINFDKLEIIVPIKTLDSNISQSILGLSQICTQIFNKKFNVFDVKREFSKGGSKFRNSLIVYVGFTLRKDDIFKYFDFFHNIMYYASLKIDNNINFKKLHNGFLIKFSNLNYFIGLDTTNLYNLNLN